MAPDSQKAVIAKPVSEAELARERTMFPSSLFQTPDSKWLHVCSIIDTSRKGIEALGKNWKLPRYAIITDPQLVMAINEAMPAPKPRGDGEEEADQVSQ